MTEDLQISSILAQNMYGVTEELDMICFLFLFPLFWQLEHNSLYEPVAISAEYA